jgi:hypothetical protein
MRLLILDSPCRPAPVEEQASIPHYRSVRAGGFVRDPSGTQSLSTRALSE